MLPEIAKLGHIAVITKNLEKSLWFFTEVIGLEKTEEVDGVHYLRAWGDFEHHTMSLTQGEESGIDHIAFRTKRPEDVQYFEGILSKLKVEINKVEKGREAGQGDSIRFTLPSGHNFELYYEMEKTPAAETRKSKLKNQTYKSWRKGISPRRIDHVNIGTNENPKELVDFLTDTLGFKIREYLKLPNGDLGGAWLSVTPLVHDIAVFYDEKMPTSHEFRHIAYWMDNAQDILRAADILKEEGFEINGPGKHGLSQGMYLYVHDPGSGLRVELFSNSYLILEPDWEPIEWTLEEVAFAGTYWGGEVGKTEITLNAAKKNTAKQS